MPKKPTPRLTPKSDWGEAFLTALASAGNVSKAAAHAGVSRQAAYLRRAEDRAFAARWDDAVEQSTDTLEAEAVRRARDGTDRPVYQSGELVGHVREYSDTLLIFLLKARRPQKYRDNARVEIAGDPANPVKVDARVNVFDRIAQLTAHFESGGIEPREEARGAAGDRP